MSLDRGSGSGLARASRADRSRDLVASSTVAWPVAWPVANPPYAARNQGLPRSALWSQKSKRVAPPSPAVASTTADAGTIR
jgi:hypothetical protein